MITLLNWIVAIPHTTIHIFVNITYIPKFGWKWIYQVSSSLLPKLRYTLTESGSYYMYVYREMSINQCILFCTAVYSFKIQVALVTLLTNNNSFLSKTIWFISHYIYMYMIFFSIFYFYKFVFFNTIPFKFRW